MILSAIWATVGTVLIVIAGFIIVRLYVRATPDSAVVRTGAGGLKVITSGGILAIPVLHEIKRVSLKVIRLDISRESADALITKDLLRANVMAAFYVKVKNSTESISSAATTLGETLNQPELLKKLIEGKLVDALRNVGSQMEMEELHRKREQFVQQVQQTVSIELAKNGLELESVSLTTLDNAPIMEDKGNFFNAIGGKKAAEIIATQRKERAAIEASAQVEIAEKEGNAEKRKAEIRLDVATTAANTDADIAKKREEAATVAAEAIIQREKAVAVSKSKADAERAAAISESKKIAQSREADAESAIAKKSEELSAAKTTAATAAAEALRAEQNNITILEVAKAERDKAVAVVAAKRAAEVAATETIVQSEAELTASTNRAKAIREVATGEADAIIQKAKATSQAMLAEADGRRALIAADNSVSDNVMEFQLDKQRIAAAPLAFAHLMEPLKAIDGVKVNIIQGIGGHSENSASGSVNVPNAYLDKVTEALLTVPIAMTLGKQMGVDLSGGIVSAGTKLMKAAFGGDLSESKEEKTIDSTVEQIAPRATGPEAMPLASRPAKNGEKGASTKG